MDYHELEETGTFKNTLRYPDKFKKRWDDVEKCIKVIDSCITTEQLFVAHNMIDNFGKKYNYDSVYRALMKKVEQAEFKKIDGQLKDSLFEWCL
jgi:hypothetical protein